jgi:hypothetical protein
MAQCKKRLVKEGKLDKHDKPNENKGYSKSKPPALKGSTAAPEAVATATPKMPLSWMPYQWNEWRLVMT